MVKLLQITADLYPQLLEWANREDLADFFRHRPPAFTWSTAEGCAFHLQGAFAIQENDYIVGIAQLMNIDFVSRNCGIGMLIDPQLASVRWETSRDAYYLITDYCFNTLNLHRITMRILAKREKLIGKLVAVGWVVEGHLEQSCFVKGEPQNEVIIRLLKSERR